MKTEDWGRIEYREAWKRQREIRDRLVELRGKDSGADEERIVVCEHNPVYTLGFHGNEHNLLVSEERLKAMGADCIRIERGGDITYHGPGQLVVYPLIDLNRHGLGVKKYVETLEEAVIQLLKEYGLPASRNNDQIGIWLDWGQPTARKICAMGIKVSHGATMHGLALNVNTDLGAFGLINPCGIMDKGVTSMERELGARQDFGKIKMRLAEIIRDSLTAPRHHTDAPGKA